MRKILLTGATGYLGGKMAAKLLENDYELCCLVLPNIPLAYLQPYADRVGLIYIGSGGGNDGEKILQFSPDIVIHMACRYDRENISLADLVDANLEFPLRVLNAVLAMPKRVLWLNTNTALESTVNGYTLAKCQFAEWGKYFASQGKLDFCNILLEHFYGEGDRGAKFFPFLLEKMKKNEAIDLTDGTQRRDFIYVDDVTDAFLLLCENYPKVYHEEISLGTGEAPRVREVVEYLHELVQSSSELRFGAVAKRPNEPELSVADPAILSSLGFVCKYPWKKGLEKLTS
jgi:nucleoside-diphosphate-sugar epimerase